MEDDKKLAWVVDKDGNVHANSETLLLREVDSLMRDENVSSSLLSSFENVFVDSLAAADDRSLVRVPCRWCVATGGALSSVG